MSMRVPSRRWAPVTVFVLAVLLVAAVCRAAIDPARIAPPPEGMIQVLTTNDGSSLVGRVVGQEGDMVMFQTGSASMRIPVSSIVAIELRAADRIKGGRYWHPDPAASRLFVFPTGRMMPRGRGYFADHELFFPSFGYGVTDWLSVSAGGSIFPGVDAEDQVYYASARVGQEAGRKFAYSFQSLLVKIPSIDDGSEEWVNLFNAVATYGSPDACVTAGLGYGTVGSEAADRPLILLGASKRFSRHIKGITENWLLPGVDDFAVLYGIRFFGENLTADLAFVTITDEDAFFPGIPLVTIGYNF